MINTAKISENLLKIINHSVEFEVLKECYFHSYDGNEKRFLNKLIKQYESLLTDQEIKEDLKENYKNQIELSNKRLSEIEEKHLQWIEWVNLQKHKK